MFGEKQTVVALLKKGALHAMKCSSHMIKFHRCWKTCAGIFIPTSGG